MAAFEDIVIISACRTAVGKFQGSLSDLSAPQLGAVAVREAVKRANLDPAKVDECIMGNVVSAGLGQNPARQAAIFGGLAPEVGAMTVNKVCGSGLKAVALAAQAIQTQNSSMVVAGGMESMTNAPYLLPQARKGYRLGNAQIVDSMVHDGLWDIYNDYHMGITGENVADRYGITREEQERIFDRFYRCAAARQRHNQGSGLGLAIVRSIMTLHGGSVTISSKPEKGTVVTLRFPHPSPANMSKM